MWPEMFPDTEAKYHDLALDTRRLCKNWLLGTTLEYFDSQILSGNCIERLAKFMPGKVLTA